MILVFILNGIIFLQFIIELIRYKFRYFIEDLLL